MILLRETNRRSSHFLRARIGGHDQDYIAEVCMPAIVVSERAVVHNLQQKIENVRMRFLNFIQ